MKEDSKVDPVSPTVAEQIRRGNPWYVGSHWKWAENPSIRPIYEKRFRYIVGCLERAKKRLGSPLRLLDAGCGDGYWLARLGGLEGLDLTGVDYNPIRIERARQAVPTVPVHWGDLMDFKTEEPFDVILLHQVIEHVQDDVGLLGRMRRLLRPEGVLILGTPNEGSWLQQWPIRRRGSSGLTDHVHFYTEKEVRRKVSAVGFRVESVMREVFFVGHEGLYYALTRHWWGFKFLEFLTWLWPAGCSDFYLECRVLTEKNGRVG